MALRFDNKVAIVTGAGGGLGRTYAIELAKRGCKVVVNDLGGDRHGSAGSTSMADKVVGEIKAAGGQAVANYNSVEEGDKIVKTAIDAWGRIDIVINNAGILRDTSFVNMKEVDWDLIFKVHVKGAYSVTKAAWPYMRDQKYGRIVVTSSNAAVYGNFGQVNYSAAKHALIGFSNSLALEGAKYNILSNAVIPTAGSRLTQTFMVDALKPEYVTPLVCYMVHDSFKDSGKLFEAGAQWYGTLQYYRGEGKVLQNATVETIHDNWKAVSSMDKPKHVASIAEQSAMLMDMLGSLEAEKSSGGSSGGASAGGSGGFPSNIQSSALFQEIADGIKADPSSVSKVKQTFTYIITDNAGRELGKFTLDFKSATPSVYLGDCRNGNAAVTVTVADQVFMDLAAGKENPQKAFMSGKIKAKGNIMLLQKLQTILDQKKKSKM
ncbi:dhs-28 [Pristionchus pacificus]|uniref:Dhs-28 n=1 Tax=Pristionchus pacificus TaxID=54126 RepID=A0A2A6CUM4_PRIPA|nr:dhs-28 [Pristionchus pacificus]|eukprot:PDM81885.1 dhs-28 [Pristionchus pacificus]